MKNLFDRSPSLFTIPPTCSFVDALVTGLARLSGGGPEKLADITLLLPSRRAQRAVQEAFLRQSDGNALLLPRLMALGDIEGEEIFQEAGSLTSLDIPPAIGEQQQLLLMTKLVARASPGIGLGKTALAQDLGLARALFQTRDTLDTEGVDMANFRELVPEPLAHHWQKILGLLEILSREWPKILEAQGVISGADRRNRLLRALAARWRAKPPTTVVIAAGSTGSIPATRDLLHVIARLPKGAVILPGLDRGMDDESWDAIDDNHPQAMLKNLLASMSVQRAEVELWPLEPDLTSIVEKKAGRLAILRDALLPAACLAKWGQILRSHSPTALKNISRVDCPGLREEAGVIALIMRETLEVPDKTVALVTRDRRLARRVASELRRWNLEVEDSAGIPLMDTPSGSFLQLVVEAANEGFSPVSLLALLKHPFCHAGFRRDEILARTRIFEMESLRGPRPPSGLKALRQLATARNNPSKLIRKLCTILKPLEVSFARKKTDLSSLTRLHLEAAERLAEPSGEELGKCPLWTREAGRAAADFCRDLLAASTVMGKISPSDYPAFFREMMSGFVVRKPFGAHPRLFIWGPLEARLQQADRMILGGMNEESWPPAPGTDPWMSRPMRKEVGLSSPERRIGQAAHDFVSAVSADDVIITRSLRIDGTPSVPSRWLKRIEALAHPLAGGEMPWLGWQAAMDLPASPKPAAPPQPKPPAAARPTSFSVTEIESWLRDPYHLYARKILGLRPLDPLHMPPGAAEKGSLFHNILDRFVQDQSAQEDLVNLEKLLATGQAFFARHWDRPGVWAFWWPRFEAVARAFVAVQARRADSSQILATEVRGSASFGQNGEFELTARADRIDLMCADKGLDIIDYKTGAIPTEPMVRAGYACQLPLEALIARNGRFGDIGHRRVSALSYWKLGGGSEAIKIKSITKNLEGLIENAGEGLASLLAKFSREETPYLSKPGPNLKTYEDYDHLARTKEWQNEPLSVKTRGSVK